MIRKSRYRKALKMRLKKDQGPLTKAKTPFDDVPGPAAIEDGEDTEDKDRRASFCA